MIDDVISFDNVIGYQTIKKKQKKLTQLNVLILQLGLPSPVHLFVSTSLSCVPTESDQSLAVYIGTSSPAPY